jgi:poly(A) polymerase
MTTKLPPRPWLTAQATRRLFEALEAEGGADCARFVGDCVRDALIGRESAALDIDVATRLRPEAAQAALERAGLKVYPTGIEHGVITVLSGGRTFEVASLRRDVETDGRRAVVAYADSWEEDAARRDFRLNALYASAEGEVFDPTGEGIADARAGRIVFVGEARRRIEEDYLRILRFFRFFAHFGKTEPDAEAFEACSTLKGGMAGLSGERIAKELLKLLAADNPVPAVRLMRKSGVLGEILPTGADSWRFEHLVEIETELLFSCDPLLRLAALLPDDVQKVRAAASRLRLSNADRERLEGACSDAVRIVSWMSPREMRRAIWKLGPRRVKDRALLGWAASRGTAAAPQWRLLMIYPDTWTAPEFPLTGEEIKKAGVPEGPLVGRVRREIEDWWLDLDFTDDRMALIERLKSVATGVCDL